MKRKTLTLLFAATVVVAAVAAFKLSSDEQSLASRPAGGELFPELSKNLNSVGSVVLQRKDGTATLVRDESGTWGLSEKEGYPVESEAVNQALIALSRMTPLEQKTDDPARYAKLGLQDPEAEGSTSTRVTVKDRSGKELARLLVGKQSEGKGGLPSSNTYVRRGDEAQCWLAKGNPELKEKPTDWLQKKILEVKRERIRSAEVRHADGELVHVERAKPEDANFELANIPEGQELSYPSAAGSIASTLEYLNLEDVLPADKVDFSQGAGPTSEFRTFDGLKITVHVKEDGDKCYARFEAAYEPQPQVGPEPPAPAADPAAPPPAPKPEAKKPEEVQKEAGELEARLSKWVYVIPAYNKPAFTKHLKDLLKAKAAPPPPPAEATTPPAGDKPAGDKPAGDKPADEKPADEKPH